jgi:hypothetical protein
VESEWYLTNNYVGDWSLNMNIFLSHFC